ncbi:hypothetical protein ColLi_02703 [Colletotrichum liriopes]|uniref:Uncharacterized protein n=1 Tax=Colletotrichum liriopes TaxID=708192 RepID=A0AA37GFA7_9PEZI|nr:hypothetical protein ColLi_02703 [Colletotrichum liriopes]
MWSPSSHDKIADCTSAGNDFLDANAAVFTNTGDEGPSSPHGAITASFAIGHIGPPKREVINGEGFLEHIWLRERTEAIQSQDREVADEADYMESVESTGSVPWELRILVVLWVS